MLVVRQSKHPDLVLPSSTPHHPQPCSCAPELGAPQSRATLKLPQAATKASDSSGKWVEPAVKPTLNMVLQCCCWETGRDPPRVRNFAVISVGKQTVCQPPRLQAKTWACTEAICRMGTLQVPQCVLIQSLQNYRISLLPQNSCWKVWIWRCRLHPSLNPPRHPPAHDVQWQPLHMPLPTSNADSKPASCKAQESSNGQSPGFGAVKRAAPLSTVLPVLKGIHRKSQHVDHTSC